MGGYGMKKYVKESSFSDDLKLLGYREGKKEIISKACEWLKEKNKMCMYELEMILGRNFIEYFKKEMDGKHG